MAEPQQTLQYDAPAAGAVPPSVLQYDQPKAAPTAPQNEKGLLPQIGKLVQGGLRSLYSVSAPGIASAFGEKYAPNATAKIQDAADTAIHALPFMHNAPPIARHISTTKESVPNAVAMLGGEMGQPDALPREGATAIAKPNAATDTPKPSTISSRAGEVAQRRISNLPGLRAAKDADYILRGPKEVTKPATTGKPAPQPIPETGGIPWGTGGKGPIELRGKMIPPEPEPISTKAPGEAGSMAESVAAPKPIAKPSANAQPERLGTLLKEQPQGTPFVGQPMPVGQRLGDLLNESMGGRVPQGHTPVKSSAILSYKYDPVSREFEATTKSGHYVTGDVSPEQFEQFKSADSKGKAWNQLRQNGTPIAKVVNGQRIAVKPPVSLRSATPDDLTPTLQESLKDALAKKKARIAKAN